MRTSQLLALVLAFVWSASVWSGKALAAGMDTAPPPSPAAMIVHALPSHADSPSRCDGRILAGRGCCSHHKGQCGCQKGRVVCCDGTLSPSCRCAADDRSDAAK